MPVTITWSIVAIISMPPPRAQGAFRATWPIPPPASTTPAEPMKTSP